MRGSTRKVGSAKNEVGGSDHGVGLSNDGALRRLDRPLWEGDVQNVGLAGGDGAPVRLNQLRPLWDSDPGLD